MTCQDYKTNYHFPFVVYGKKLCLPKKGMVGGNMFNGASFFLILALFYLNQAFLLSSFFFVGSKRQLIRFLGMICFLIICCIWGLNRFNIITSQVLTIAVIVINLMVALFYPFIIFKIKDTIKLPNNVKE